MERSGPQDPPTIEGASKANSAEAKVEPKPEKKAKKPKKTEFFYQLHHVMNNFNLSGWHEFPETFHVVCDSKGVRNIIQENDDKVCSFVEETKVTSAIMDYCFKYLTNNKEAILSYNEAYACFQLWRALTPPIDEDLIKPIAEKDDDSLCWHRLPFNITDGMPTPTFDEMFSRFSNGPALKAFIGSLFFKDASREQYAFIYGLGRNGKGALARFLHAVMGPTYGSQQPPVKGDRFWLSGLLGVRLAMFADCEDLDFITSGVFKSLTGGDAQKIEEKGKQVYTTKLNVKCMFMSNDTPRLTSQTSDIRRSIYCEAKPITQDKIPTHIYDAMLWQEASPFLHECIELYKSVCPNHGDIPIDDSGLLEIVGAHEEPLQIFLDKHFVVQKEKPEKTKDWFMLSGARMQEIIGDDPSFTFKKRTEFMKYLEVSHGIKRKAVKLEDGTVRRLYLGIREKTAAEKSVYDQQISGKQEKF